LLLLSELPDLEESVFFDSDFPESVVFNSDLPEVGISVSVFLDSVSGDEVIVVDDDFLESFT